MSTVQNLQRPPPPQRGSVPWLPLCVWRAESEAAHTNERGRFKQRQALEMTLFCPVLISSFILAQ